MYDKFSSDYDRFVNWQNRLAIEMPFLLKLLGSVHPQPGTPLRVLDAACGTGQHAIALSRASLQVVGADLSPEMIAVARTNAASAGVNIRFETIGFGSLAKTFGAASFDALLCLGNSLPHLLTPVDLADALQDFHRCLAPGGLLIIQNRNFDGVLANHDRWMGPEAHSEGDREWLYQRFYDFEPDGLIRFNIVTLTRVNNGEWSSAVTSTHLRPQKHKELSDALVSAGFTTPQPLGSLTGELFVPLTSGNLVLVASKP